MIEIQVTAEHDELWLVVARLRQSFTAVEAEQPQPAPDRPGLYELQVRALADGLEQHAVFLRRFAADFEPIRAAAAEALRPPGIPPLAPLDGDL